MDTTESEVMHAATIWKSMSEAQRLDAAAAFWDDDQSIAEQAEVVGVLARQLNFRPKSIVALPLEKRARMLARMGKVSDLVAGRLLVSYHLAKQRSLMGAFLDSLGIGHEEGLISDDDVKVPDEERVVAAAEALYDANPPEDVTLYFSTLLLQDGESWGALRKAMAKRSKATETLEPGSEGA